ncbi:TonB-dependent receptor [Novosphingobium sp.]|uniref:TonB-dependent receptor n=1 Tax=Novosphingobium sp. TaxID=1874826 RepID=UPI0035AF04C5
MTRFPLPALALLCSSALSAPALAAEDQAPAQSADAVSEQDEALMPGEIVVLAARIKGQVDAPEKPIASYDEGDIAALGASSLADLLDALAPQTGSGRGRSSGPPVVLVNGQRITNFREMRNYPPEAIKRVEVLPEEVALRFGFPPDTRVVNMILKDNFSSRRAEATYGLPSYGGFAEAELEATLLKISGPNRLSVNGSVSHTSPLFEAERGVIQTPANTPTVASDPDPAAWRSLIAANTAYDFNTSWSKGLGKDGLGGAITLSGRATRTETTSYSGLNAVTLTAPDGSSELRTLDDPLRRHTGTTALQAGAGINTFLGDWQLSATLDGSHSETISQIEQRADTSALVAAAAAGTLAIDGPLPAVASGGYATARTNSDGATGLVTLIGRPFRMPAGEAVLTLKTGYAWANIESSDTRTSAGTTSLTRGDFSVGTNLALPLASRRENTLAALGDITLNLSAGWNHLSDFGGLTDWSAGLNWAPLDRLSFGASYIVNDAAPTLAQLGNPTVQTYNVPVYDYATGQTALVTVTSGGNPALRKERQRDWKFSANWQLPIPGNSNLVVEYFRNRSNDVSASFPTLTAATEAAFPGRVVRDSAGNLIAIDQRPVTLAEQTGSRLRWGINLGGTVGKAPPPGPQRGGPGGRGPGGVPGMGPMGGGQGRWQFGLFHTVQFESKVLIAPGVPTLDLLNGDALTTGGTPRHSLELNGGMFYKGFGFRTEGTWNAPTHVNASGLPGSSDLRFGAVTKFNLNLFADFDRIKGATDGASFLKGARLVLKFENLFDSRQKVTDASGAVPLSYQPDYLDPRGRVISLELRKMF